MFFFVYLRFRVMENNINTLPTPHSFFSRTSPRSLLNPLAPANLPSLRSKMFSKLAIVIVASLGALSVSATTYSCNTGAVQCCNSVQNSGSYDVTKIASLLGVVVGEITGQIALQCSPATVIGAGTGASWYVPIMLLIILHFAYVYLLAFQILCAVRRTSAVRYLFLLLFLCLLVCGFVLIFIPSATHWRRLLACQRRPLRSPI